jgi:hypothetical protein
MIDKEFVPYELALELKQLGFNEPCFGEWQNLKTGKNLVVDEEDRIYDIPVLGAGVHALTYSQAFRWFRDKFNCHHTINLNKKYVGIAYSSVVNFSVDEFNAYEEAELACLKKLIEIANDKQ